MRRQSGISIIELMISIAIGSFIMATVVGVYLSNKSTYLLQEGLARLQENGRYATAIFDNNFRMAGFQGCNNNNVNNINNLINTPPSEIITDKPIIGHEGSSGSWSPKLPKTLTNQVRGNTDVIIVRTTAKNSVHLTANMATALSDIAIDSRLKPQAGDYLLVTDCENGDIIKAGNGTSNTNIIHNASDNLSASLSKPYQTDAQVTRYEYYAFYIKDSGRTNKAGNTIYSLFRKDINGTEEEYVEGVENMQVIYGVDTNSDGTADTFSTANSVDSANQWSSVVSIKISLLLNSIESVNTKTLNYTFQGVNYTPSDRLSRKQWDIFIQLRNNLI